MKYISVALDGPAGAGKSTIAKSLAKRLNFIYVDTGALYRAIGLYAKSNGIDTAKSQEDIIKLLPKIRVELRFIEGNQRVFLNGEDVSERIRLPEMSMHASNVSAVKAVRDFLFSLQQDMAKNNNVIMDGRDIGTVVLPNATVKLFLTASSQERARRRFDEYKQKGQSVDYDQLLNEIIKRDNNDYNREIAPLKQADDAILIDTTNLNLEQSINHIELILKTQIAKAKNLKNYE